MKSKLIKVSVVPVDPTDPKAVEFAAGVMRHLDQVYGFYDEKSGKRLALDDEPPSTLMYRGQLLELEQPKPVTTPRIAEKRKCGWDSAIDAHAAAR
jgi:hypothetical protein